MGVVKALWNEQLLPRVISGASAGSLMAALIGAPILTTRIQPIIHLLSTLTHPLTTPILPLIHILSTLTYLIITLTPLTYLLTHLLIHLLICLPIHLLTTLTHS